MSKFVAIVQKSLKRLDRSLSGPLAVFSEQFLYGHREILCSYAGLDAKAMFKGSIEHGWALNSGLGIPRFAGGRYLYLSWCKERLIRSGNSDLNSTSVGAPFIYALKSVQEVLLSATIEKTKSRRENIFFPVHGTEHVQQNASSQIQLFKERYNPLDSAVCLYWIEFINPEIYNLYKAAGFEIHCAGFSGQMEHTGLGYSARKLAGSPMGGRPTFLLNTIAILSSYPRVVLGGFGTICFYAAYLNRNIELLHGYYKTEFLNMDSDGKTTFDKYSDEVLYRNFVSKSMNCDFEDIDFNSIKFRELAQKELGHENLRQHTELQDFLLPHVILEANPQSLPVYQEKLRNFRNLLDSIN